MISKETKRAVGELLAANFETEELKEYFLDMCEHIPDYIFTMPSSTTGKYHNATQCQRNGQLYHVFMFASILEHRLALKHNKEIFYTPELRDALRCVPFFHDALKCGDGKTNFSVFEHPVLAAEWVKTTKVKHDISDVLKTMIADMCAAHSGEWTTSKRSKVVLPEPKNETEFFIHECDVLASRADLDWIISEELKTLLNDTGLAEVELPDINTYKLTFGKHAGLTIPEIAKLDPNYFSWMKENINKEPVKSLLKSFS